MAGAAGLEPATGRFGGDCATSCATHPRGTERTVFRGGPSMTCMELERGLRPTARRQQIARLFCLFMQRMLPTELAKFIRLEFGLLRPLFPSRRLSPVCNAFALAARKLKKGTCHEGIVGSFGEKSYKRTTGTPRPQVAFPPTLQDQAQTRTA